MPLSRLTICALFTALIAVLAQIALPIPFSPIPFTGQLTGILLAAYLLKPRYAIMTVTAYILLGAAGAPIFALARGGLAVLFGPTGGYLWGFIPAVLILGRVKKTIKEETFFKSLLVMVSALPAVYITGLTQLHIVMGYSLWELLLIGAIPYLPLDIIKAAIAAALYIQIKKALIANRLAHLISSEEDSGETASTVRKH